MRELPYIVLKEFNLIKSQKMTLALIIIYPLLVIGALGAAFGTQINLQTVDVALFIPAETELGTFSAQELIEIMENTKRVKLHLAESREDVEALVKKGESDFGLVVRKEKTVSGQIIVDLLLDNSNFIVSGIILSIGFFVFNVQFQQNALEIAIAIAITSFSFISLGLFITNFAKTQSTAVLGSLILILPMIFLSGTILPLQLMNPVLQIVSEFLPLTAANILLSGALIKGIPLIEMAKQVAILLIPGIVLTAFSIKKF
jgi:hypothetical protein